MTKKDISLCLLLAFGKEASRMPMLMATQK